MKLAKAQSAPSFIRWYKEAETVSHRAEGSRQGEGCLVPGCSPGFPPAREALSLSSPHELRALAGRGFHSQRPKHPAVTGEPGLAAPWGNLSEHLVHGEGDTGSHLLRACPVPGSVLSRGLQAHGDFVFGKIPRWRNADYPRFTGEEAAAHRK